MHNAADVTVKNAAGVVDIGWVTAIVSSDAVEANISKWLAEQDIVAKPDCGARNRFSAPGVTFTCSVPGYDKNVVVTMDDFRGHVSLKLEDS